MPFKRKRRRRRKGHYFRGVHNSPIAGECHYRSGWEQKYMEYLDLDPNVKFWAYEELVIDYVSNKRTGKMRKYYPDFLVEYRDGTQVVVEIKPQRKLEQALIQKKLSAAQEWCMMKQMTFKVITEIELKDMGLL